MDTSKLDRSEIIGMVAATVLVISLFLEWFSLSTDPSVVQRGNRSGQLGLRGRQLELQRLGHLPDCALAAARGGRAPSSWPGS